MNDLDERTTLMQINIPHSFVGARWKITTLLLNSLLRVENELRERKTSVFPEAKLADNNREMSKDHEQMGN